MGGLQGRIGLPALQPVPCLPGSCVGGERQGHLVYKHTWSIGNCATCCNIPAPSSCRSLAAFKPLNVVFYDHRHFVQYIVFFLYSIFYFKHLCHLFYQACEAGEGIIGHRGVQFVCLSSVVCCLSVCLSVCLQTPPSLWDRSLPNCIFGFFRPLRVSVKI